MVKRILIIMTVIIGFSVASQSQVHVKGALQHAQDVVDKFGEEMLLLPVKRDSLVETFKVFFEDSYLYRKKGSKMLHGLELNRDAEVRRILINDKDFAVYQKFMKAMADHRAKIKAGNHAAGHH